MIWSLLKRTMSEKKDFLASPSGIFSICMGLVAMLLLLLCTSRYGIGLSPDSTNYIFSARSLLAGNGLPLDGIMAQQAPLFPILLSVSSLSGLDPLESARYLNTLLFGLIIFVSACWLRKEINTHIFFATAILTLLLGMKILSVSIFAWTEPLFILLSLLSLFFLNKFLESWDKSSFIFAVIFVALACLCRYIGVTIILTGVVLILLRKRDTGILKKLACCVSYALLSAIPLVIIAVRNQLGTGTLFGIRFPSGSNISVNIQNVLKTIGSWFLPGNTPAIVRIIVVAGVIIGLCTVFYLRRRELIKALKPISLFSTLGTFIFIYSSFVLISASLVAYDPLSNRLMIPIYIPLVMLTFLLLDNLPDVIGWSNLKRILNAIPPKVLSMLGIKASQISKEPLLTPRVKMILTLLLGFWIVFIGAKTALFTVAAMENGAGGYNTEIWRTSETMLYLEDNPLSGHIYSNGADVLYILLDLPDVESIPRKAENISTSSTKDFESLNQTISEEDVYLVWFDNNDWRDYLYSPGELGVIYRLEIVEITSDGSIYRMLLV